MNKQFVRLIVSIQKSCVIAALLLGVAFSQNNPIPQIVGPVHPDAVAPGSRAFTLSVYGANFVPNAIVSWNYEPRTTTYISAHEIQAQILASDIAGNTAGYISVTNPAPGGGSSSASWAQVEVHDPISDITVASPQYYEFGFETLMLADFTHGAVLDVIGEYAGSLDLKLGTKGGAFYSQSVAVRNYEQSTQPGYGDFNGDGKLDVVAVLGNDNGFAMNMGVDLGDGRGNFTKGTSLVSKLGFGLIAVGDFDRDGKLDLVTKGYLAVQEFLGNGDGSFRHSETYPYSAIAAQMLVGDFDRDGVLDLVFLQDPSRNGMNLWFVRGNGDGTFQSPTLIRSFLGTSGCIGGGLFQGNVQLSDFNGDGVPDLVFCTESQIGVMLGNGDGTFGLPTLLTIDPSNQGLFTFAIGDVNSDGNPDLLVSEYGNAINLQLQAFLGNGDGTFKEPQNIAIGQVPWPEFGMTAGDFNSDGRLDFIFQSDLGMDAFFQQ